MVGFPTWITYGGLFSIALNSSVMRGWPGAAGAVVAYSAGALLWGVPMGYVHYPQTSDLVTLLCFFGSLAYSCAVRAVGLHPKPRVPPARPAPRRGAPREPPMTQEPR